MVKVRMLKSFSANDETKQIATKTAKQTGAFMVEATGHTFMLYKSDKK
jgi:RNA-binding protein YhbY